MAQFIEVPVNRVADAALQGLLEEYASRDGTDYGAYDVTLKSKVQQLQAALESGALGLVFDAESETWDLMGREEIEGLLDE